MIPCWSQVTTLSTPFEADVATCAEAGWPAIEIWLTKLEQFLDAHDVSEARTSLEDAGIRAIAASFQGGLLLSSGAERTAHFEQFQRRLELLEALSIPVLVIVPDFLSEPIGDDLSRAGRSLAEAAELAGKHRVRLALEFQRSQKFCASLDSTVALLEHSGADAGICLDVFHYYCGPSKLEDLAYVNAGNLAHVQLNDLSGTPRELAGDADRIFPGEGDFVLGPILDHLARIGYLGGVSLEVPNPRLWEMPADRVASVGLAAMRRILERPSEGGAGIGKGA